MFLCPTGASVWHHPEGCFLWIVQLLYDFHKYSICTDMTVIFNSTWGNDEIWLYNIVQMGWFKNRLDRICTDIADIFRWTYTPFLAFCLAVIQDSCSQAADPWDWNSCTYRKTHRFMGFHVGKYTVRPMDPMGYNWYDMLEYVFWFGEKHRSYLQTIVFINFYNWRQQMIHRSFHMNQLSFPLSMPRKHHIQRALWSSLPAVRPQVFSVVLMACLGSCAMLPSLKLTAKAPENRPTSPKRKSSNPTKLMFSCKIADSFRECLFLSLLEENLSILCRGVKGLFCWVRRPPFL